ncbi:MAG: hypothetical protein HN380_20665 [Victivallales bacterium]|nr:hypothetical protein [Victivallales bacterium]
MPHGDLTHRWRPNWRIVRRNGQYFNASRAETGAARALFFGFRFRHVPEVGPVTWLL